MLTCVMVSTKASLHSRTATRLEQAARATDGVKTPHLADGVLPQLYETGQPVSGIGAGLCPSTSCRGTPVWGAWRSD